MSSPKTSPAMGADWTQLLTDPDLVRHLGKLLQIYRDAAPDKRDQALRDALREIKSGAAKTADVPAASPAAEPAAKSVTTAPEASPPFEPDIFTPSWGQDRRRYPRMKCFVAVELRLQGSQTPIWGNLSNTSLGGCFVETASPVPTGVDVELGLWVATGKIWVKGIILNGIVTKSNPCFGVRIKFGQMQDSERESLREFLKFVEGTTKGYQSQHGYLAQLKR
ncbi:MAG TPA: PilZ domain-containing protein [Terriglobales bacterium]|nr:PilZ domain-containing protein [Terriglobales bacterium]